MIAMCAHYWTGTMDLRATKCGEEDKRGLGSRREVMSRELGIVKQSQASWSGTDRKKEGVEVERYRGVGYLGPSWG